MVLSQLWNDAPFTPRRKKRAQSVASGNRERARARERERERERLLIRVVTICHTPYMCTLLNQYINPFATRSNDWLVLMVPYTRTELGKTSFPFAAPHSWNLLQNTLKLISLPSLGQFKSRTRDVCVCLHVSVLVNCHVIAVCIVLFSLILYFCIGCELGRTENEGFPQCAPSIKCLK